MRDSEQEGRREEEKEGERPSEERRKGAETGVVKGIGEEKMKEPQ